MISYPFVIVPVPADWKPQSWKTRPPSAERTMSLEMASALAVMANQHQMNFGPVNVWTFRCEAAGSRSAMFTVDLKQEWDATSPFDFPPDVQQVTGESHSDCRDMIEDLNATLSPGSRAIVVRSLFHADPFFLRDSCRVAPHHPRVGGAIAPPSGNA